MRGCATGSSTRRCAPSPVCSRSLPRGLALRLAAAVAGVVIRIDRRHRRIGLTNLAIAFPEKTPRERLAILIASYRNLGRMVAEWARLPTLDAVNVHDVVRIEDQALWSELPRVLRQSGVLVLTGHFGNWELFAYAHGLLGYPVHLVGQTIKNPLVDRYVIRMRERAGDAHASQAPRRTRRPADARRPRPHGAAARPERIAADGGLRRVLRPARQHQRRFRAHRGACGRRRCIPRFSFATVTSARHRIVILPRVPFASMADRESAAREFTQRCTAVLEDMIRRYPDHWLWTHKRWRTRPAGEREIYDKH